MTASVAPPLKKSAAQRVGPFQLLDELSVAGVARAFRARYALERGDTRLGLSPGDIVVIKVLRDGAFRDDASVHAFSREAELLSMIDHPSVARGITRGTAGGRVWCAMEYIEGEDVGTVFRAMTDAKLRMRPELVVSIAVDVLAGLAAAQALVDARGRSLGLIHRDVSPRNIMIDLRGHARVIDFGAALLSMREEPTAVVGTPGYMAPEQARGEQLTQAVDVYAMGVMMFELLTGRRAFPVESATDAAVLDAHAQNQRTPWPKDIDVPLELRAAVDQALSTEPERRPHDAGALYGLLEALLQEPEEARRRLALVARDLCRTDPDRPAPFYC